MMKYCILNISLIRHLVFFSKIITSVYHEFLILAVSDNRRCQEVSLHRHYQTSSNAWLQPTDLTTPTMEDCIAHCDTRPECVA
jgi:hypothetical protein